MPVRVFRNVGDDTINDPYLGPIEPGEQISVNSENVQTGGHPDLKDITEYPRDDEPAEPAESTEGTDAGEQEQA